MLLHTLGGLELRGANFRRPKPLLLLAYLAVEGPQERRFLAELFWPRAADPRQSLTVALSQLHRAVPGLVRTERLRVQAQVACDALVLKEAATNHEWERVAALYEGTFLAGVDAEPGNVEMEEWLYATRELLALIAQGALIDLAELSLTTGDLPTAGRHADRAATLAPSAGWEAPQLDRLHALLVATGSPRASTLRKEADALGFRLQAPTNHRRSGAGDDLPVNLTPFVGRESELAALQALVWGSARLIAITGLGGIGKTRLAVELARRLAHDGRYAHVHFVPLGGAPVDEQFAPLLASTLGRHNRSRRASDKLGDPEDSRHTLLVVDDLVPSPAARAQIEALLASMPQLEVIVTAREPLGSLAETQFQLAGLALTRSAPEAGTPSDAEALFVRTAKRFDPAFTQDADAVLTVCEMVAGSPLGIELAASLTRVMSPGDLLSELRLSLGVLDRAPGAVQERHPSVRVVFDSSWARLTAPQRAALAGCALFTGGFTRSAATEVLGLDVRLLSVLLERSLLRRQGGRFELHPLVQEYALEKLDTYPEAEEWRERHAVHYITWFASKRLFYQRSGQRQALEELAPDFPNLQAAWSWAVGAARTDLLEEALSTAVRYLLLRGRTTETARLLQLADTVAARGSMLHALVLRWQAVLSGWEDPVGAHQLLTEALQILTALKREEDLGILHYHLGLTSAFQGDPDAASQQLRTAIVLLEERDDEGLLAAAYSNLSLVTSYEAEHEALARRAHAASLEAGNIAQLAICLANEAGEVHYTYGDSSAAVGYLQAAIELEENEGGRDDVLERFYHRQAHDLVNLGDLTRAEQRLEEAVRMITERGTGEYPEQTRYPPLALVTALLSEARGDYKEARAAAEAAPDDRLCREVLCRLALQEDDIELADQHLAVLRALRGYGFAVRARLHEAAVERLLTGELAGLRSAEATASGDLRSAAQLRSEALAAFADTVDDALEYTFMPLALEVFTAAYALDPRLCEVSAVMLAARHPASRFYVRRRAESLLPEPLPPAAVAAVGAWLKLTPMELAPVVTDLAERFRVGQVPARRWP